MAYIIPLDQPLSETQAKLIAQVGSMKNLTDLSFFKKFKFKKEDEMSMFDYLLKVLRSMGIDPQILVAAFLNEFFRTEKMVALILNASAQLCTAAKKNLDTNSTFVMPTGDLDEAQKKELTKINYDFLNSGIIKSSLVTIVEAFRIKMIQEMMVLIFGKPKSSAAAYGNEGLVRDENRLNELMDEAVCGGDAIFSVSSPMNNNYGELEYNRIQKLEQIKNGNLTFQITCQGVKISLPDNPMYLFSTAPPGFQGGVPVSPQEAMTNVFNYVGGQIQKGTSGTNSQSNAITGSKSFAQKFLETLISSITCLLMPLFNGIPGGAQGMGPEATLLLEEGLLNYLFPGSVTTDPFTGKRVGEFVPFTSCEITQGLNKANMTTAQKKKVCLATILCNLTLNIAIGFILAYVIEEVKKMIKNFIAQRAQAKTLRKKTKIKNKLQFSTIGKQQKKVSRSTRQVAMMKVVMPVLKSSENVISVPTFNNT